MFRYGDRIGIKTEGKRRKKKRGKRVKRKRNGREGRKNKNVMRLGRKKKDV